MKILIYISHFSDAGGAEKVVSLMANHWVKSYEVVILSESIPEEDFFEVNKEVQREVTGFKIVSKTPFAQLKEYIRGIFYIREALKKSKPDIIISHIDMANIRMLIASIGLNIPVIVEDHNNPELKSLSQPWKFIKPLTYLWSERLILLTKDLLKFYPSFLHKKVSFIENPLNIPTNIPDSDEVKLSKPTFIALGSLVEQKGLDYLLEACAIVFKEKPNWHLTILGEGKLRESISLHAKELGIDDKVHLAGRVTKPYSILKDADIYVMSSRFEGFPVALCEAMGVGLPCISFDCPTGPADIIEHNVNGLLVEYLNVEALAESMLLLANDKDMRERFSKEALKINEKLSLKTIMSKWDRVIEESLNV